MLSFNQKLRIGVAFYRLYRRYPLVRWYSRLAIHFAPRGYRQLSWLLDL